jgi:TPP-dependent indolepyruvate ferredoxin oxidoreductase alpha subunit
MFSQDRDSRRFAIGALRSRSPLFACSAASISARRRVRTAAERRPSRRPGLCADAPSRRSRFAAAVVATFH